MSFLTRTALRAPRSIAFAPRAFSTSFIAQKSATESVKDTAHSVDKAVANKIVDGIELGEKAAAKVKEAANISSSEAKGKANKVAGEAKGKAAELKGEAKGKYRETKGKL
ncbi:hypothetical protein B0O99DRAFT_594763 [Bisporella sp. PMI_857]|nr:hypothetical protein B0O99DRAFT_594763 [Bisporella sp. PMI_857]